MHNLKDIRKDFSVFAKSLEKRSINLDFENLQKLDEQNRQLIQQKEALEKEKKDISKSKDEKMFKKSKEISLDLEKISENQKKVKIELEIYYQIFQIYLILMSLMVKMKMTILKFLNQVKFLDFDFKPKSHYELGENLKDVRF